VLIDSADIKTVQDRRHWALDQLLALCRNNSIPKGDDWVSSVLEFLLVHGFFNTKKADKKSNIVAVGPIYPGVMTKLTI
jgi:DNA polymerase phi